MQGQEWIAHLDACKREGIPLKTYATRHGLAVDSLYYWRRKVMNSSNPASSVTSSSRLTATGLFTRLQVSTSNESTASGIIHLRLGTQIHLEMNSLPPVEWLAALARTEGSR